MNDEQTKMKLVYAFKGKTNAHQLNHTKTQCASRDFEMSTYQHDFRDLELVEADTIQKFVYWFSEKLSN